MANRLDKRERREQIVAAALDLAEKMGYQEVHRSHIAERLGCSEALIRVHFSTLPDLRRTIVRSAVKAERLGVIAQAIANRSPYVKKISEELKARALHELASASTRCA